MNEDEFMATVQATFPETRWSMPYHTHGVFSVYAKRVYGVRIVVVHYAPLAAVGCRWQARLQFVGGPIEAGSIEELRTAYELELVRYS